MKARTKILGLLAALALAALALPAAAHSGHALSLNCPNPSPNTAGSVADSGCSFTTSFTGQKVTEFRFDLPTGATLNEKGNADGSDPSDGEQIGQATVATDLSYDGCGDNNDGGTYPTNWETTFTSYPPGIPAGWTKVAQDNTVFTVLFFFTENVPTHVIQNNTTGQYATITDVPEGRGCTGATTNWDIDNWGYADQDPTDNFVGKNPTTTGNHTVKLTVTESTPATHDQSDTITIS